MNENEQKQQGLQLELTPDKAQGEYANFAIITHSSSEFIVDFARMLPRPPVREPQLATAEVIRGASPGPLTAARSEPRRLKLERNPSVLLPSKEGRGAVRLGES